jgi:hypothetical protein
LKYTEKSPRTRAVRAAVERLDAMAVLMGLSPLMSNSHGMTRLSSLHDDLSRQLLRELVP